MSDLEDLLGGARFVRSFTRASSALRDRIVSGTAPWGTPGQSAYCQPGPACGAVAFEGFDRIGRTGRLVATAWWKNRRDQSLIASYEPDECASRHDRRRPAALVVRRTSEAVRSAVEAVTAGRRAMMTMSSGTGTSVDAAAAAARRRRRVRFLPAAGAIRLLTAKPQRVMSREFGMNRRASRLFEMLAPSWKTRSKGGPPGSRVRAAGLDGGKALAAMEAAGLEDGASAARGHAFAEAVGPLSLLHVGLVSALGGHSRFSRVLRDGLLA